MDAGSVLVLDDSEDLLDVLRLIIERQCNLKAVTLKSMAEVVAIKETALACKIAILDINLGPNEPNGVDVYHWLRSQAFQGQIVFLTGHAATHPIVAAAQGLGDARVFTKPLSASALVQMIRDA